MKVRLTPRALSEAKRKKTWWRENRPAAPDLFEEELSATIDVLRTTLIGTVYPANLSAGVRRALMPRTRNYLYYAVQENEVVVLSVWGTPRERGPKL
jgi:plasmid stabilization system protein ParE